MYCLRYWFPLLAILPWPKSPPLILFLFMVSMAIHHKPCAYCSLLLTLLMVSTCSRDLASSDVSVLSSADPDLCTVEPLVRRLPAPSPPLPPTSVPTKNVTGQKRGSRVRPDADEMPRKRCWCDANGGKLLDPFPALEPVLAQAKREQERRMRSRRTVSSSSSGDGQAGMEVEQGRRWRLASFLSRFSSSPVPASSTLSTLASSVLPQDLPVCDPAIHPYPYRSPFSTPPSASSPALPPIYTHVIRPLLGPRFHALLVRAASWERVESPWRRGLYRARRWMEGVEWDKAREVSYKGVGVRIVLGSKKVYHVQHEPKK